jgi:hypothetical protein
MTDHSETIRRYLAAIEQRAPFDEQVIWRDVRRARGQHSRRRNDALPVGDGLRDPRRADR